MPVFDADMIFDVRLERLSSAVVDLSAAHLRAQGCTAAACALGGWVHAVVALAVAEERPRRARELNEQIGAMVALVQWVDRPPPTAAADDSDADSASTASIGTPASPTAVVRQRLAAAPPRAGSGEEFSPLGVRLEVLEEMAADAVKSLLKFELAVEPALVDDGLMRWRAMGVCMCRARAQCRHVDRRALAHPCTTGKLSPRWSLRVSARRRRCRCYANG